MKDIESEKQRDIETERLKGRQAGRKKDRDKYYTAKNIKLQRENETQTK